MGGDRACRSHDPSASVTTSRRPSRSSNSSRRASAASPSCARRATGTANLRDHRRQPDADLRARSKSKRLHPRRSPADGSHGKSASHPRAQRLNELKVAPPDWLLQEIGRPPRNNGGRRAPRLCQTAPRRRRAALFIEDCRQADRVRFTSACAGPQAPRRSVPLQAFDAAVHAVEIVNRQRAHCRELGSLRGQSEQYAEARPRHTDQIGPSATELPARRPLAIDDFDGAYGGVEGRLARPLRLGAGRPQRTGTPGGIEPVSSALGSLDEQGRAAQSRAVGIASAPGRPPVHSPWRPSPHLLQQPPQSGGATLSWFRRSARGCMLTSVASICWTASRM